MLSEHNISILCPTFSILYLCSFTKYILIFSFPQINSNLLCKDIFPDSQNLLFTSSDNNVIIFFIKQMKVSLYPNSTDRKKWMFTIFGIKTIYGLSFHHNQSKRTTFFFASFYKKCFNTFSKNFNCKFNKLCNKSNLFIYIYLLTYFAYCILYQNPGPDITLIVIVGFLG